MVVWQKFVVHCTLSRFGHFPIEQPTLHSLTISKEAGEIVLQKATTDEGDNGLVSEELRCSVVVDDASTCGGFFRIQDLLSSEAEKNGDTVDL